MENLKVSHNGEFLYYLNPNLVFLQKLTAEEINEVISLHEELYNLFDEMEAESDQSVIQTYVGKIANLEFKLQEAWKFPFDNTKHSWWYKAPHCTCPKLDNQERWGVNQRVINKDCILHGQLTEKEKENES